MTRETAIKGLKAFRKEFSGYEPNEEMFDMAIKALEQEPCEDAVSRKAVDRLVWEYLRKATDESIAFYEHFLDLPSVTPIRPKGHWIDKFAGVYRCSCCREIIEIDIEIDYPNGITFNYCPMCGAKMIKP